LKSFQINENLSCLVNGSPPTVHPDADAPADATIGGGGDDPFTRVSFQAVRLNVPGAKSIRRPRKRPQGH
jgi:hypothetical protein